MKSAKIVILSSLFCLAAKAFAHEQDSLEVHMESLSGPRFGVSYIIGNSANDLKRLADAGPTVVQFGWQFEHRFMSTEGVAGLAEFVPMIGGFEQSTFIPSAAGMVGLRTASGFEIATGPFIGLSGTGLAAAIGYNFKSGGLNLPVNLGLVSSKSGFAVSMLVGFNARKY